MKTHYWFSLPPESEAKKNRDILFNIMLTDMCNAIFCFVMAGMAGISSLKEEYKIIICVFLLYIAIKDFFTSYIIYRYQK